MAIGQRPQTLGRQVDVVIIQSQCRLLLQAKSQRRVEFARNIGAKNVTLVSLRGKGFEGTAKTYTVRDGSVLVAMTLSGHRGASTHLRSILRQCILELHYQNFCSDKTQETPCRH